MALHEHRHFGRAALACFVSQPTLSAGIAELERLLGIALVERSKRSVRFTAQGEEVVDRAHRVIRAAEDLRAVAERAREPLAGTVRMAAIPTVAPFLLPRILSGVAAAWPRLRLVVREALTGPACDALHRGTMDCVLLALPNECGNVDVYEVMTDRLILAVPGSEPELSGSVRPDAIDTSQLLLLEDGHCLRDHALTACNAPKPASDAPLVASTLETLVRLVDAGLGSTLLPEMGVAAGILAGSRVRVRHIDGLGAQRRIALVWRKDHPRRRELHMLGDSIRASI